MKIKRFMTLAAALIMLAGTASVCSADNSSEPKKGDDYETYQPFFYFNSYGEHGTEYIHVMNNGAVYIDTNELPDDGGTLYSDFYVYDKYKLIRSIMVKLRFTGRELEVKEAYNGGKDGNYTYGTQEGCFCEASGCDHNDPDDYALVSFMTSKFSEGPDKVLTEKTNDYPLFTLETPVRKDTEPGMYDLYVFDKERYEPTNRYLISGIMITYPEFNDRIRSVSGEFNTKKQHVAVSDRSLGDVDDNGSIDEEDAEIILSTYSTVTNNYTTFYTNGKFAAAADVDLDGEITDKDAEIIMDYVLEGEEGSFYDYLTFR